MSLPPLSRASGFHLRPSEATNLVAPDATREDIARLDEQTGRDHISHSALSTFLACHRRYELHYLEGLRLISTPKPLTLGRAFQLAIEHQDPLRGGEAILVATVASQEDYDRLRVDAAIVMAAAKLYLSKWPASQQELREYAYRVRLRNPATGHYSTTFDLVGFADGLVDCGGWLELIENKLTSGITALNVRRVPLDRQVALARYGLWRATGKEVRRTRYRWIRKPSIKQRQNESVDAFIERLSADYEERPDFYSVEEQSFNDPADMLRVEAELWSWAQQLRDARRRGFWDRNTSHCHDYGGCQFIPVCAGEEDAMALYERVNHEASREAA
jgi:hypothetical protein